MSVKITNNVLEDKDYLNFLVEQTEGTEFPWYYIPTSAHHDDKDNGWQFSFFHMLVEDGDFKRSNMSSIFEKLINECVKKSGYNNMKVDRARLGLFTRTENKKVQVPHVDKNEDHKTIVYYLNNSDGDTYFYGKRNDDVELDNYYVEDKSTFKQNSMVSFDGNTLHSSSSPLYHNVRIALNINLL